VGEEVAAARVGAARAARARRRGGIEFGGLSMKPLTKDKTKISDEVRNKCVIGIYIVHSIHSQHLASMKSEKEMTE
jgi:hypothetical protein